MMTRTTKLALTTSALFLALLVGRPENTQATPLTSNVLVSATVTKACTIVADPIGFGLYDPTSASDVFAQGNVTFTCTVGTPATVTLDNGQHFGGAMRGMAIGTNVLPYQIYSDSVHSAVFTTSLSQNAVAGGNTVVMYGKLPAGTTSVIAGVYKDTVVATLNF